ncbi:alpha-1,6-glucosidase domain-containing protein [Simiduia agarivorans]|uniref:Alpha-1,6-glucosidase n=1 Tax=Simiduia agarivorans (strain DSM 21679 / JCM 13881 / BCRC 17597 / SA1) TaxID=1117647 RepID=K4KJ96_SIMAS|nr:alpha-1,6-glucosidase domain-containing protein [Simiduia agarivorans]AFU99116.1 alpha-1,6-glucosidase [Simiduia agarivorans SA1 = DSM 21679]
MSQSRRLLGLSALTVALLAMAGCKTDVSGDQSELLTCSNNLIPNDAGTMCVERPLVCPDGQVPDDDGAMCVDAPFAGPDPLYFPAADEAVIYFNRQHIDQAYGDWVLHLWNSGCTGGWASQVTATDTAPTNWPDGPSVNGAGVDPIYGAYWVLNIQDASTCGNWIVHNTAGDNQTNDYSLSLSGNTKFARMAFVIANDDLRTSRVSMGLPICINDVCEAAEPPARAMRNAAAHWIDATTLVWNTDGSADGLFAAETGGLDQDAEGNIINSTLSATLAPTTLTSEQAARVPHLANWAAFSVEGLSAEQVKTATKGQIWVTGTDAGGNLIGTEVQSARLLDALYTMGDNDADEADLGVVYEGGNITVSVWAPTAHNVRLKVFNDASPKRLLDTVDMTLDSATGIWSYTDSIERLDRRFYRFSASVYDRENDLVATVESTDPYSVGAAERAHYSQFVNLDDADTQPDGWGTVATPMIANPEAAVIYEGHVRDFSILDASTSAANRGKYLAFTESGSVPMQHLAELKASGLTHFHALPTADIGTIDEVEAARVDVTDTVAKLCNVEPSAPVCGVESDTATILSVLQSYDPTTNAARDLVESLRGYDGFNWGYDPVLYNVPEGSYASDADGIARIKELRAMNQALNAMGLRTVMDVVYNHTSGAGLIYASSTFDKLVPGYYYRRDPVSGAIETVSCCNDTAPENVMFGKFVKDSLLHWATQYGYNDFRFDLMTFLPKQLVVDSLAAVQAVNPDTYFYGEGWNMGGSSEGDAIFERAEQFNMAGTGVGTFNDRMRDPMRYLALIKGENVDRIRIGLAGNLKSYEIYNAASEKVTADTIGAYTEDPQESVNYVSKHDNETLWDMIQKEGAVSVDMSAADRARIQNLTLSMNMLSQGVPFFHMGSDLLRSKSMDRNTYDAGDWYNYVDFTQNTNNWAIGMPLDRGDTSEEWIISQFNNMSTKPVAADIQLASDVFNEFLRIAQGSPLFSLATAQDVSDRVGFHNTGSQQIKGIIAMSIDDGLGLTDLDANADALMVVFNGNGSEKSIAVRTASGFSLHPVQAASADAVVRSASFSEEVRDEDGENVTYGTFTVPAYTTAVFVKTQAGAQGEGLAADATVPAAGTIENPYTATPYLRGDMNGWSTNDPFIYNGDGSFTVFANLTAGTSYSFKFASEDWGTVNFGAQNAGESAVQLGVAKTLARTNDNLSFTPTETAEYRFTIVATNSEAPVLTVTKGDVYDNAIFLKGGMNGWGDVDEMVYVGKGLYRVSFNLAAGNYEFKIADSSWSAPNIGAGEAGDTIAVASSLRIEVAGNPGNLKLAIADAGDYTFTLDTRDSQKPTLHLVPAARFTVPVFVRGSMNGWSEDDQMTEIATNVYQVDIALTAGGYEWKVASADWSTVDRTANGSVKLYQPTAFIPGAGQSNSTLQVGADTSLRFTLDANFGDPLMTITVAP